jgi:hypothetical protein
MTHTPIKSVEEVLSVIEEWGEEKRLGKNLDEDMEKAADIDSYNLAIQDLLTFLKTLK